MSLHFYTMMRRRLLLQSVIYDSPLLSPDFSIHKWQTIMLWTLTIRPFGNDKIIQKCVRAVDDAIVHIHLDNIAITIQHTNSGTQHIWRVSVAYYRNSTAHYHTFLASTLDHRHSSTTSHFSFAISTPETNFSSVDCVHIQKCRRMTWYSGVQWECEKITKYRSSELIARPHNHEQPKQTEIFTVALDKNGPNNS